MTEVCSPTQYPDVQACAATAPQPPRASEADFRSWFEDHFDYVWHTMRRLGVRASDLEDLSHDVFLQVYRNLGRFEPGRPVRPWLFGFAFRVASDYRRRASHRLEQFDEHREAVDPEPGALELLIRRDEQEFVHAVLGTLELSRRAVFILHELDGSPIPEVAVALEIPLNTAYSRLRLARKQFALACERRRRAWRGGP